MKLTQSRGRNCKHIIVFVDKTVIIRIPHSKARTQFHKCLVASYGCKGLGRAWGWGELEQVNSSNTLYVILGVTAVFIGTKPSQIKQKDGISNHSTIYNDGVHLPFEMFHKIISLQII